MLAFVELVRVVAVLSRSLVGSRLQAAVQPDRHRIVLTFYGGPEGEKPVRRHLVLSGDPRTARVGLQEDAPKGAGPPPGFIQYLRAHAVGARVSAVRQEGGDRQLAIDLETADGAQTLLLAIFGRRSNVYALDGRGCIVAALRPLQDTRSELALGQPWRSPSSPPRREGEDRFAGVPDAELLLEIERRYASEEAESLHADLQRRLEQALRREVKTLDRKLEKLERELASAEAALGLERQGELLKSVMGGLSKGDREAVVRDWDSGEQVRIPLDPKLSPSENLESLFKRYRKALRTLTKGGAQLEAVKTSRGVVAGLESALADAVASEDEQALPELADRPELSRLLGKYAPGPAPAKRSAVVPQRIAGREVPARLVPRRYRTESGLEVWVGRSDEANDFLSTRLARGKDLFFHLDGAPGSHVILRTEGRDDPPSEALLDACELAVHFSKFKKASRADVHVVPIKNVKKPKGAKPGLVMVHGGRSVHLRRSEARLRRILDAKIED
jgi:predicted ribosome quality control (RQC) complex YloA/Tae2 family protein